MRVALAAAAIVLTWAPALAQTAPSGPASEQVGTAAGWLLTRYAFHLSAEHLSGDDQRFVWDTQFGGELDVVDFGAGRGTFYANYQAVLGEEFRRFDPSHGNYILGGVLTVRLGAVEVGGVFHHQSRHLSDRPKRFAVDWNMFGGRVRGQGAVGRLNYDARGEVRRVVAKSYVDYRWDGEGDVRFRFRLRPGVSMVGASAVHLVGTDGSRDRGLQAGFREEGGVRLDGRGAAVEVFVAVERRVDPDPLEFGTATWVMAGFRLVNK